MTTAEPSHPCVLLVEDDTILRQSLSIHLEREKINVDVAEEGAEAMRLLDLRSYDVVVIDLNLPRRSGHELVEHLATSRNSHDSSVVVITADEPGTTGQQNSSVISRTFTKPLDFEDLARSVRALCGAK